MKQLSKTNTISKNYVRNLYIFLEWRKHEKEKANCVRRTEQGRIAKI